MKNDKTINQTMDNIENRNDTAGEMPEATKCCCELTTERSAVELKSLMNRLSRVEGQIRGIKGMLERDAYCTDILIQVSAANAALNGFARELLANHLRTCVTNDIREGNDAKINELVALLPKFMK